MASARAPDDNLLHNSSAGPLACASQAQGDPLPVEAPTWLNPGDTSWQITAATLVGLMSVPGLAVLYGGVMQKRWSINSMMLAFVTFAVVLVIWVQPVGPLLLRSIG